MRMEVFIPIGFRLYFNMYISKENSNNLCISGINYWLKNETNNLSYASLYLRNDNSIYISMLETKDGMMNNGYASLLLNEIITDFGEEFNIKLQCTPVNWSKDTTFKERKEQLKKFYEKFGFEVYDTHPQAYFMIRYKQKKLQLWQR